MDNNQNLCPLAYTDKNESLFFIPENGKRIFKRNKMFLLIRTIFIMIPFKPELIFYNHIICIL